MGNVYNIKWIAKALKSSPVGRKLFANGVATILYILEAQKLLDWRKLQEVAVDFEKGTISTGDGTVNMIIGRAISQYVIDRKKNKDRALSNAALKRIGEALK